MISVGLDIGGVKLEIRFEGEGSGRFAEGLAGEFPGYISLDRCAEIPIVVRRNGARSLKDLLSGEEIEVLRSYFLKIEERFPFSQHSSRWKKGWRGKPKITKRKGALPGLAKFMPLFKKDRAAALYHSSFLLLIDYEEPSGEAILLDDGFAENASAVSLMVQAAVGLLAPLYGGMMLHACSLIIDDGGYLFFGGSGAGKSTIAHIAGKESLLSDDGTLCFRRGGIYHVTPSPFTQVANRGNIGGSVPVKGLFFLVKDKYDFIEEIAPGEAMLRILHNHIHFFRYFPRREAENTFFLLREIAGRFPFYNLHFSQNIQPLDFFGDWEGERKKVV